MPHWEDSQILDKYNPYRGIGERFRSEEYFLEKLMIRGAPKIVDVGSACGDIARYIAECHNSYDFSYLGVELSHNLFQAAKARYETKYYNNPLNQEMSLDVSFYNCSFNRDFVNKNSGVFDILLATGFIQHSANPDEDIKLFKQICQKNSTIIFDVKLFTDEVSLLGGERAYCDHKPKIPYNVFNLKHFTAILESIFPCKSIEIFGYRSGIHESVVLPKTITETPISAHVCVERGPNELILNLSGI